MYISSKDVEVGADHEDYVAEPSEAGTDADCCMWLDHPGCGMNTREQTPETQGDVLGMHPPQGSQCAEHRVR